MRGRTGATSTQARARARARACAHARTFWAPHPHALQPRLDIFGFLVSLLSDRAHAYHSCGVRYKHVILVRPLKIPRSFGLEATSENT